MKCIKGIWLRCGLLPYYLRGQQLALALLLGISRAPPPSSRRRSPKRAISVTRRRWKNCWPASQSAASCRFPTGVYRCTVSKLDAAPYTENQLLDLIGMTQGTVNGTALLHRCPACKRQLPRPQRLLNLQSPPRNDPGRALLLSYVLR